MVTSSGGSKPPAHAALARLTPTAARFASVAAHEAPPAEDPGWAAFVAALYLADVASYPRPVNQVDLAHLHHVVRVFPRGFRLWSAEIPGAGRLPVGYSGWYPIAAATFARLEHEAASMRDRAVPPLAAVEPGGGFVYLFNYSVVPQLRGTSAARRLMQAYAGDVDAVGACGMAAITVSGDGERVAGRFGMRRTGTIVVEGCEEGVFTRRGSG